MKLEIVNYEAERLKFLTQARRTSQEAKDEAARLVAEAGILEKVQNKLMTQRLCLIDCWILWMIL